MPDVQGGRCAPLGRSHLALAFAGVLLTIAVGRAVQKMAWPRAFMTYFMALNSEF